MKLTIAHSNICKRNLAKCLTHFNYIMKLPDFDILFSNVPKYFGHFDYSLGKDPPKLL